MGTQWKDLPLQWNYVLEVSMNSLLFKTLPLINFKKIKSMAYSPQGSHTGQLDFCSRLADDSTAG